MDEIVLHGTFLYFVFVTETVFVISFPTKY